MPTIRSFVNLNWTFRIVRTGETFGSTTESRAARCAESATFPAAMAGVVGPEHAATPVASHAARIHFTVVGRDDLTKRADSPMCALSPHGPAGSPGCPRLPHHHRK